MESEELVLVDLADWLAENWEDGVRYVLGPGSTLHGLARNLGLETTLLGVDVLENGAVIARDVDEARLFELVDGHPAYLLVTAIGGQGHVIGRGNQQISPRVLRAIGLERMRVVATKRKLGTLGAARCWSTAATRCWTTASRTPSGSGPAARKNCCIRWDTRRTGRARGRLGGKGWTRTYPARCAACCCSPCSDCRWWRPLRSNRSDWWMRRVPRWALPGLRPGLPATGLSGRRRAAADRGLHRRGGPCAARTGAGSTEGGARGHASPLRGLPAAMGNERYRPQHRSPPRTEPDDLVQPPGPGPGA